MTYGQMIVLYEHCQKREELLLRFHAAIHGAKIKGEEKSVFKDESGKKVEVEGPIFKDPKEYEHMTDEEKEKETQKMMGQLKQWSKRSGLGE